MAEPTKRGGKTIIYTDLDGSFLDEKNYSFLESLAALRAAQEGGIPVIFCSSKTRSEIEHLRKAVEVSDPFIVENGGAIFVPEGYFPFAIEDSMSLDGYRVIELGESYVKLVDLFHQLRAGSPGLGVVGFSDLTAEELAIECGMTIAEAERAKARGYTEPFRFSDITSEKITLFLERIRQSGRRFSIGGRYHHLNGDYDKGRAVKILTRLYRRANGDVVTVGIGDSQNDASMLEKVTLPIIVKRPSHTHDPNLVTRFSEAWLTEGIGPRGWAEAVAQLVSEKYSINWNPQL